MTPAEANLLRAVVRSLLGETEREDLLAAWQGFNRVPSFVQRPLPTMADQDAPRSSYMASGVELAAEVPADAEAAVRGCDAADGVRPPIGTRSGSYHWLQYPSGETVPAVWYDRVNVWGVCGAAAYHLVEAAELASSGYRYLGHCIWQHPHSADNQIAAYQAQIAGLTYQLATAQERLSKLLEAMSGALDVCCRFHAGGASQPMALGAIEGIIRHAVAVRPWRSPATASPRLPPAAPASRAAGGGLPFQAPCCHERVGKS